MQAAGPDARTLVAFAAMILLAGANAIGVWYSNAELAPFWGAALRFGLAAALFAGYALARGRAFPRGRARTGALLYGALGFGAAYACAYYGIGRVAPGMAQVILALVPLATLLLAALQRQEPFRWRGLAGALLAAAGIAVVFREQLELRVSLAGLVALLIGALAIAESSLAVKNYPKADPVTTNAVAMGVGATLLLALSFTVRETHAIPRERATLLALAYLILVGSVVVFLLFLYVLHRWTASASSFQFVLYPFVTLALSAWLTGERLTSGLALGALLVLAGVYAGALWKGRPERPVATRSEG